MDGLIELIVNALIALFSGGRQSQSQTPRPLPRTPPARRPGGQPINRQYQNPQRPAERGRKPMRGSGRGVPPRGMPAIPLPAAPPLPKIVAKKEPAAPPPTATPSPQTTITAAGIRQLLMSRRSAVRTVFVLSEVVGPSVGLRDSDRNAF